jgi:hypothetical protein
MSEPSHKSFRQVFPELSDEEAVQAEANFEAYLALIIRIYDRISADPQAIAELRAALAFKRKAADDSNGFDISDNVS